MNFLITQRTYLDKRGHLSDRLEADYTQYYPGFDLNLFPVSNFLDDPISYIEKIDYDGLLISGGGDVSHGFSGMSKDIDLDAVQEREMTIIKLTNRILKENKPVLAVCYGMQFINCYFGGRLEGNIHSRETEVRTPGKDHKIKFTRSLFGISGEFKVNHYHNVGMRQSMVPSEFDIFAMDTEYDVVEGMLHKSLPILAVQWHPERKSPDNDLNKRIIQSFLQHIKNNY